tara:strand:- start:10 stop:429 length:420 start_codon:yes stop_codon:yes gene_type:complete
MPLQVYEVFEKFSKAKNKAEKVKVLKENNHHAVRDIIRGGMDPSVEFLLPKGRPPYNANREESTPSTLLKENQKFKYIVKGFAGDDLNGMKRESIFIGILEAIHPQDAEHVLLMLEKKPPVKGMTKKIVEEAYPGLIRK